MFATCDVLGIFGVNVWMSLISSSVRCECPQETSMMAESSAVLLEATWAPRKRGDMESVQPNNVGQAI